MKSALILIVLLGLGIGMYSFTRKDAPPSSTDETSSEGGRIRGPEDGSLSVGQSATIGGLLVALNDLSDSRCAIGVQCIWEGAVSAAVTLSSGASTSDIDITLDADPVAFEGYLISLTAALPYPKEGVVVEKKEYILTFHVVPSIGSDGEIPANI